MQLLHHKWALIDKETLIVGSANWTTAAFTKNQDCFLVLPLKEKEQKFMKNLWKVIQLESLRAIPLVIQKSVLPASNSHCFWDPTALPQPFRLSFFAIGYA